MKRYIAILLFVVALPVVAAAQLRTSYFMEGSTFRTDMNPALAPTRGYINIPGVGNLGIDVTNNFLSIDNLFYPTDNGLAFFMNREVDRDEFLKRLPRNNNLEFALSEQLLGLGRHTRRFFWSAGLNFKANVDVNIPKSFFSMVTNLGQGSYSMQNLHAGVNSYFEAFVGAAVPIKDFITIGARVKGLWGLVNASLEVTDTVVNITDEKVDARLAAEMVGCVPMIRSVVLPNGELNMDDIFAGGLNISQMLKDASNVGFAVDLGAEVRLLDDDLRLSAAITDLGFINWNKNSTLRGSVSGGVAYEGLNVSDIKEGVDVNFSSDEIVIKADDTLDGYSQRLNCQLNFGAEYAILNNHISFGLLSHTKFCRTFTYSELTTSVNFKPLNWITATVSHTFLNKNQPGVFGFAFNFHPAGLNLFVGADFIDLKFGQISSSMTPSGRLLLPVRQRSVNMHLGMAVSLGRAKYTKAYKADVEAGRAKPMPEKKSKSKSAKK